MTRPVWEPPIRTMRGPVTTAGIGLLLLGVTVAHGIIANTEAADRWSTTITFSSAWVVCVFAGIVWGAVVIILRYLDEVRSDFRDQGSHGGGYAEGYVDGLSHAEPAVHHLQGLRLVPQSTNGSDQDRRR